MSTAIRVNIIRFPNEPSRYAEQLLWVDTRNRTSWFLFWNQSLLLLCQRVNLNPENVLTHSTSLRLRCRKYIFLTTLPGICRSTHNYYYITNSSVAVATLLNSMHNAHCTCTLPLTCDKTVEIMTVSPIKAAAVFVPMAPAMKWKKKKNEIVSKFESANQTNVHPYQ